MDTYLERHIVCNIPYHFNSLFDELWNGMAEDILDVSKIEGQSLILNKERLNLNDVILNAIQDIKDHVDDTISRVQVMYNKADGVIFLEADRYRVTQVVTNLLNNAVKFVKGYDGTVSISIEKKKMLIVGKRLLLLV